MGGIITSLLDLDSYKLSMGQAVFHQFPGAHVKYKFKCRTAGAELGRFAEEIKSEIIQMCELKFNWQEIEYLRTIRFLKPDYIDFLEMYKPNAKYITVKALDNGDLGITIEGPWFLTIYFETLILSIVNEVYYNHTQNESILWGEGQVRLLKKVSDICLAPTGFRFADFGTRRRFSKYWQDYVVGHLASTCPEKFIGTSNVYLAMKHRVKPIGTMAHEWLQAGQALGPRLIDSQKFMLQKWVDEYRGDLGIALSDVVGFKAFLKDFDLYFAKLYDGCRHDSGDPYAWCEQLIRWYKDMGIDPKTKSAVFSDCLTIPKAIDLYNKFGNDIKTSFGIGTNLTNDVGVPALQCVIKMTECQYQPVAKLSDSEGKQMCEDDGYLAYLNQVFGRIV